MRFIPFFVVFILFNSTAQTDKNLNRTHLIGSEISFSYRNKELFHGFNYALETHKFSLGAGIKFGVKSTYFQATIFPQLNLKFAYLPLKITPSNSNNQLSFGPQIQLNSGFQRVQTTHSYSDFLLGYEFSYGNKWRFFHSLSCGSYLELFKDYSSKIYKAQSLTYYLTFGLNYAIN